MPAIPKTIFDTLLEDFLKALESDPEVPGSITARLRQLASSHDLKPENIRDAIVNNEAQL
jgi:hypothetical protein